MKSPAPQPTERDSRPIGKQFCYVRLSKLDTTVRERLDQRQPRLAA